MAALNRYLREIWGLKGGQRVGEAVGGPGCVCCCGTVLGGERWLAGEGLGARGGRVELICLPGNLQRYTKLCSKVG